MDMNEKLDLYELVSKKYILAFSDSEKTKAKNEMILISKDCYENLIKLGVNEESQNLALRFHRIGEHMRNQLQHKRLMLQKHNIAFEGTESILQFIKTQHEEIVELEKSVEELFCLFLEFQVLSKSQGKLLTAIGDNVDLTKENLLKGISTLKSTITK